MAGERFTRRQAIKGLTAGAASTALAVRGVAAGGAPTGPRPMAARGALQGYQGKFVIFSLADGQQEAPLIDAIKQQFPGVDVEWRTLASERFVELFTASEVAGDQIDLMDLNGQDLRRYAVGGRLQDLSDITYKDRFRPVAQATYTIGGKLWALPRGGISGFTFFYNKKALQKAGATKEPETYQDLLDMAPALKAAGIAPFTHAGKNIYLWPVWQFWAYAQTSGNQSIEKTIKTLQGETKFTDPEHLAGLEILAKFAGDGLFVDSVNSLDSDAAWLQFSQGKAAFLYTHSSVIATYRQGDFPELDMALIPPVRAVDDSNVVRQLPGGTGSALGIYAKIDSKRADLARSIIDFMTSDQWVKWQNDLSGDPVSCNANVVASDDPLALAYGETCSPNQITYLDWLWPPEITRAFQENQQAIVDGSVKPDEAAKAIQEVLDGLYDDGYKFQA